MPYTIFLCFAIVFLRSSDAKNILSLNLICLSSYTLTQLHSFFLSLCFSFTDNELYSGTVADFSGSDPIIYREPLQTEQYDSLSLNGKLAQVTAYSYLNIFIHTYLIPRKHIQV